MNTRKRKILLIGSIILLLFAITSLVYNLCYVDSKVSVILSVVYSMMIISMAINIYLFSDNKKGTLYVLLFIVIFALGIAVGFALNHCFDLDRPLFS